MMPVFGKEKAYSAKLFSKSTSLFSIKSFKITAKNFFVNTGVKQTWFEVKGAISFLALLTDEPGLSFSDFEQEMILR